MRAELGDFQTPQQLADDIVSLGRARFGKPSTIIEPTCGCGAFISSSLATFPDAIVHGLEVQHDYIKILEKNYGRRRNFILHSQNYFDFDWDGLLGQVAKPLWVIGNPPWVTNSALGKLDSANRPERQKQSGLNGFDAISGKSNFDISEYMMRQWFHWAAKSSGALLVICKTSVARKVLKYWWKQDGVMPAAEMRIIDAQKQFGAAVSACVLLCDFRKSSKRECAVFPSLESSKEESVFGFENGRLISDLIAYRTHQNLMQGGLKLWRSGIKHDCSKILELEKQDSKFFNKIGCSVDVETDRIFPLMKGGDVRRFPKCRPLSLLLPQLSIGESDSCLKSLPKTRSYLHKHVDHFEKRRSSIYKKGGKFSIFGIGDYSFKPWKIAISALNKELNFKLIGPHNDQPVMFDDTVYFSSFDTKPEASQALAFLESDPVQSFMSSMIFWDDMRPIKTEILNAVPYPSVRTRELV